MADSIGTKSDPAAQEWAIHDRVLQLRVWGTGIVYPLPDAGEGPVLGASDTCSIRIDDPSGQVSRTPASCGPGVVGAFAISRARTASCSTARCVRMAPSNPAPSSGSEAWSSSP